MADREILNFEIFIQHFRKIHVGSVCENVNILLVICFVFRKYRCEKVEKQKMCRKTKSRAYQLHFGTILSSKLPIGFENGSIEVHEHDLVTAQDG